MATKLAPGQNGSTTSAADRARILFSSRHARPAADEVIGVQTGCKAGRRA
jgi:hypothetical protein